MTGILILIMVIGVGAGIWGIFYLESKKPFWYAVLALRRKERRLLLSILDDMQQRRHNWIYNHERETYLNLSKGTVVRFGASTTLITAGVEFDGENVKLDAKNMVQTTIEISGESLINKVEQIHKHREKELDYFIGRFKE